MPSYYQSSHSLFIQAPPERVYEALTDWEQRAQWRKGISMIWDGNSKAFLNQKVVFKVKELIPYTFSFRISGLEPPRRIYMEYSGSPLSGSSAIEITPEEGGSRVAFHWMKVEPGGWFAWVYFSLGLGMRSHRIRTMETLRMLKDYLEETTKTKI